MPPSSGTTEHRCTSCQSDRTGRAEHFIVSGGAVVREEYRCAVCGNAFWVQTDGVVSQLN